MEELGTDEKEKQIWKGLFSKLNGEIEKEQKQSKTQQMNSTKAQNSQSISLPSQTGNQTKIVQKQSNPETQRQNGVSGIHKRKEGKKKRMKEEKKKQVEEAKLKQQKMTSKHQISRINIEYGIIRLANNKYYFIPVDPNLSQILVKDICKNVFNEIRIKNDQNNMFFQEKRSQIKQEYLDNYLFKGNCETKGQQQVSILELEGKLSDPSNYRKVLILSQNFQLLSNKFYSKTEKEVKKIQETFLQKIQQVTSQERALIHPKKQIFSIDNSKTKVIDDAISIERVNSSLLSLGDELNNIGVWKISIHISDVAAVVKEDSSINGEAMLRVENDYGLIINQSVSMLPFELSSNLCSILANHPRYALTTQFYMNEKGIIDYENMSIYQSVILSQKKLKYEEGEQILKEKLVETNSNQFEFQNNFKMLNKLMLKRRQLRFQVSNYKTSKSSTLQTQNMIEELMHIQNLLIQQYFTKIMRNCYEQLYELTKEEKYKRNKEQLEEHLSKRKKDYSVNNLQGLIQMKQQELIQKVKHVSKQFIKKKIIKKELVINEEGEFIFLEKEEEIDLQVDKNCQLYQQQFIKQKQNQITSSQDSSQEKHSLDNEPIDVLTQQLSLKSEELEQKIQNPESNSNSKNGDEDGAESSQQFQLDNENIHEEEQKSFQENFEEEILSKTKLENIEQSLKIEEQLNALFQGINAKINYSSIKKIRQCFSQAKQGKKKVISEYLEQVFQENYQAFYSIIQRHSSKDLVKTEEQQQQQLQMTANTSKQEKLEEQKQQISSTEFKTQLSSSFKELPKQNKISAIDEEQPNPNNFCFNENYDLEITKQIFNSEFFQIFKYTNPLRKFCDLMVNRIIMDLILIEKILLNKSVKSADLNINGDDPYQFIEVLKEKVNQIEQRVQKLKQYQSQMKFIKKTNKIQIAADKISDRLDYAYSIYYGKNQDKKKNPQILEAIVLDIETIVEQQQQIGINRGSTFCSYQKVKLWNSKIKEVVMKYKINSLNNGKNIVLQKFDIVQLYVSVKCLVPLEFTIDIITKL